MATKFSVETVFKATDKVSGVLARMSSNVTRFADKAERSLNRVNAGLNNTSAAIGNGVKATAAAAAASGATLASITRTGADFEQQITSAAVKMGVAVSETSEEFKLLNETALALGASTEFSASQAATALKGLGAAGFNAKTAVSSLPVILDLASSAELGLEESTAILLDTLGQFGLRTEDPIKQAVLMSKAVDSVTKSANLANLTVPEVAEALKQVGPVSKAAGASLETTNALIVALAEGGKRGGEAGTALRAVFTRLQAPVGEAAKVLGRLGVQTRDSSGNMLDVIDILGTLDKSLEGLGTAEKGEILKRIFGEEPIAAVNILLAKGSKELDKYASEIDGAGGITKKFADILRGTTQADINNMSSAIEGLTITLFDLNKDGIRQALSGFTAWIGGVDKALLANKELGKSVGQDVFSAVVNLAKVIAALVAWMIVLKVVSVATTTAIIAFRIASATAAAVTWAWAAATAAMPAILATARAAMLAFNIALWANPIGVVVGGIAALIAIGGLLIANWDKVSAFFSELWGGIKWAFTTAIDGIMAVVNPFIAVIDSVRSIWDQLRGTISQPIEAKINASTKGFNLVTGAPLAETATTETATAGMGVIGPQEGIMRSINENRSSAEITLRNETNARAEVSQQRGPMSLQVANSGAF